MTGRTAEAVALDAASHPRSRTAPVRIVHLGLGAFHRAHLAWYTDRADPAREWGIAAFTGRRPDAALVLGAQDGLYTLVERGPDGDRFEVIESLVEARDGADVARLRELLARPEVAIVSLTITEPAYLVTADGRLDTGSPEVSDDIARVSSVLAGDASPAPSTMPGRLVAGLAARRDADVGGLSVVSCDNLSRNGQVTRAAVLGMAEEVDPDLRAWIEREIAFVDTSVDRITPRTTDDDVELVQQATQLHDRSPVVTEPFRSWVLAGEFPAGRPSWEDAGAVFVDDIEPFERRKLWLLNAAHSLLAYSGIARGHATVAEALADADCARWVEELWDEAAGLLRDPALDLDRYRADLRDRFANARIAHHLTQIAEDGTAKLRARAVPVLRGEREAGRSGAAAARLIAAWMDHVAGSADPAQLPDARRDDIADALAAPGEERTVRLLALLDTALADDAEVVALIEERSRELHAAAGTEGTR
ncbi:fructuronate reductase [Diaminobutyricimonas aerilata]|uniref:Mannitol-1-phosphate 5-dehydrogenase n=1 Tax=Diaminobutyricimonas aerilata TaxID=1162967 RepID=A0A2M9CFP1_9MICO|nr:mannitol dehydrogenase family protein [Diaminobutyricimonas aerilata]PJJ70756.1 fructuronate reductase [Diaminobutyricimonas aerilata]